MQAFGWRIPFLLGGVLGIIGYVIRKKSVESHAFIQMRNRKLIANLPVRELARYPWHCLCGTLLITMLSIAFLIFLVYIPATLITTDHSGGTPTIGCYTVLATVFANLILAFWLDKHSHKLMMLAIYSLLIFGVPLMWFIFNSSASVIPFALLFGILTSLASVAPLFLLTSLFPVPVRYSGISIVYGLGFAIGGTTPALTTWLSYKLSQPWASGYILAAAGIIGLSAYVMLRFIQPAKQVTD